MYLLVTHPALMRHLARQIADSFCGSGELPVRERTAQCVERVQRAFPGALRVGGSDDAWELGVQLIGLWDGHALQLEQLAGRFT